MLVIHTAERLALPLWVNVTSLREARVAEEHEYNGILQRDFHAVSNGSRASRDTDAPYNRPHRM